MASHGDPSDPLLLCLHGIGSCGSAFDDQAPLADLLGRHVVAWDAPGYRHTPDPPKPFTLDDWADAAADVIRREGGGRPADVLGVSWGGVTGTRLALRHPELVHTLILADSSTGSGLTPQIASEMRKRAADVEKMGLEPFARSRSPRLLSPDADPALRDGVAQMMIDSVRMPSYGWACDSMADTDHRSQLYTIAAPTLVLVGSDDVVTPPHRSEELADGIPGAELGVVADAGHLANQEQPTEFNAFVRRFLERASAVLSDDRHRY